MNLKQFMVAIILFIGHLINAQNFKGQVLDQQTNKPVQEAHIFLNNKISTYSDSSGKFELTIPDKEAEIKISFLGFKDITEVIKPQTELMIFHMEEAPIFISGVMVTGNTKTDPVFTVETNDYVKKIVQPRNVADLFNDVNGFSLIKRGNYANDPSFRANACMPQQNGPCHHPCNSRRN